MGCLFFLQGIAQTHVPYVGRQILYRSATREASLVQGKEQIGSRRAKRLPSLFSFQGLTLPRAAPSPVPLSVRTLTQRMSLWTREGCSWARSMPRPLQTSLRQSSLLPTGRGGTFAQKTTCEAAEPNPGLGVVGPGFTSEETGSEGP